MIDTIKVVIPCSPEGKIRSATLTKTDPDGVVLKVTGLPKAVPGLQSALRVRTRPFQHPKTKAIRTGLEIEGSFVKFLHGHNLFGPDNLCLLVRAVVEALRRLPGTGVNFTPEDLADIEFGNYWVNRVDVTEMYKLPAGITGQEWVYEAERGVRHRRKRATRTDDTLYIQKESQRWTARFYLKDQELRDHPLPVFLPFRDQLENYAAGTLRVEFTLRRKELEGHRKHLGRNWRHQDGARLFAAFLARLSILGSMRAQDEIESQLTNAERRVYKLWRAGVSIATIFASTTSRLKQQRRFAALGVDLLAPPAEEPTIDLRSVVDQPPLGVPAFAREHPMLLLKTDSLVDAAGNALPTAISRLYVLGSEELTDVVGRKKAA